MKRQYWTAEERAKLKSLYEIDGLSVHQIASILNRSSNSIKVKTVRFQLKHSKEQTSKIKHNNVSGKNNPMFGKSAWSRGLTKNTDERLKNTAVNGSKTKKEMFKCGMILPRMGKDNPMFGKHAWNNGLTKETSEKVKQYGLKCSIRQRERWLKLPEEEKNKIRIRCAKIGSQKKFLTSIELKVHDFLNYKTIVFIAGHPIGFYVCDIYVPSANLVIECQGDYWHGNPREYNDTSFNLIQKKNIRRDKAKATYLKNRGFNHINIWEYDIRFKFDVVKEMIISKIREFSSNRQFLPDSENKGVR